MSTLLLDHFFILTDQPDQIVQSIERIGLKEGSSNTHPGQGTANRRFYLSNIKLELLTITDPREASNGPARELQFVQRLQGKNSSRFGIITRLATSEGDVGFPHWRYQPDYFPDGVSFLVGENSSTLVEPLCICMPPALPFPVKAEQPDNPDWEMSSLRIDVDVEEPSPVLNTFSQCRGMEVRYQKPAGMKIVLNNAERGQSMELAPILPVIIEW